MDSFEKYLTSPYYVPNTVFSLGDTEFFLKEKEKKIKGKKWTELSKDLRIHWDLNASMVHTVCQAQF